MKLYHGSNTVIKQPDLNKSKPYKDFGQGFYLTADRHHAQRLAEQRASFLGGEPFVNTFLFDETLMQSTELRVKQWHEYCVEWGRFVMQNRDHEVMQPCHNFDIVYGPIADDGVAFQIRRCKAGSITIEQMVEELKYERGITFQYYFGTQRALTKLIAL